MDPLLVGTVALIGFAILMVAIAWRRWTNATASFSRVEALRALVAESSRAAGPSVALPPATDEDSRPASRAGALASPSPPFVVTLPDRHTASPTQLSFQRTESRT